MPDRHRLHPSASSRSTAPTLAADVDGQLESALVVDRLAMPDMFTLVFRDPDRDILGQGRARDRHEGEDLDRVGERRRARAADRRRGHLDRGRVRHARDAGRRPRLRPVAPAGGRPQDRDVPERQVLGHRAARSRATPGCRPTSTTPTGRSTTSSRPNQSDLDFLYGLARQIGFDCRVDGEKLLFKKPRRVLRRRPGEGDARAREPDRARVGRQPARVPGADERRRPGQRGQGPRLGPRGEGGGHRHRPTRRRRTPSCRPRARPTSPTRSAARRSSSSTTAGRHPGGRRRSWPRRGRSRSAAPPSRRRRSRSARPTLKAGHRRQHRRRRPGARAASG